MNNVSEEQHRRWMRNDAHLWRQPNRKLWLGPAYVERKREAAPQREPTNSLDAYVPATGAALGELKRLVRSLRLELALRRHRAALRHVGKAGFNPDQPRDWHGRWTDGGGSSSSDGRIRLAGDIPTGDSPEIPKEPPPTTRLRNILIRSLASRFGAYIWAATEAGSWIYDHKAEINSYFDAPKSLQELQEAANSPADGYDIHHVVERNAKAKDGSEDGLIDAPENLVRIPRWKHWEINAWYQIPNKNFGWMTPRQYLRDKSWDERTRVGLVALRKVGILQ